MKFCFFDSSALVKRYVQELAASSVIFVSRVTWVEVLSAFARLSRERKGCGRRIRTGIYSASRRHKEVGMSEFDRFGAEHDGKKAGWTVVNLFLTYQERLC